MKVLALILVLAAVQGDPFKMTGGQLEHEAKNTIAPLIKITVHWIFPAVALMSALYGVVRGVKRGEWDFTVICLVASIALAMIPTIVAHLFGVTQ
jgi:hypothetical protein